MHLDIDVNDLRLAVTALSFLLFVGLAIWTWLPGRRVALDSAARLPFDGDATPPTLPADPNGTRP